MPRGLYGFIFSLKGFYLSFFFLLLNSHGNVQKEKRKEKMMWGYGGGKPMRETGNEIFIRDEKKGITDSDHST